MLRSLSRPASPVFGGRNSDCGGKVFAGMTALGMAARGVGVDRLPAAKMPCSAGFWKTCGITGGMNGSGVEVGVAVGVAVGIGVGVNAAGSTAPFVVAVLFACTGSALALIAVAMLTSG